MFYISLIIALAIFLDVFINDGGATTNIINAIAGVFHRNPMTIDEVDNNGELKQILEHIESIKEEIDGFNDDLLYDNSPEEIESIQNKIEIRKQLLEGYLYRLTQHKQ